MKKAIVVSLIILLIVVLNIPIQSLQLIDLESGNILRSFPIKNGEEFTVYFTHSVERTPWYEIYSIKNDKDIYLQETRFYSYGAGLPATTTHNFSLEEDSMHITNYNQKMNSLIYKIGGVLADHKILINNKEIPLDQVTEPFHSILFQVEKLPLYKHLEKEVIGNV